jgi:putative Mn2+ efflux pump MntP
MLVGILILGFTLSLDNFRSSAPLFGGLLGRYFGEGIGPIADCVGPAVMGLYGVYLLIGALRKPLPDEVDHPWVTLFGMPLSLSVDNLLAGTGPGVPGFSPVVPARSLI